MKGSLDRATSPRWNRWLGSTSRGVALVCLFVLFALVMGGCKRKITPAQCDQLLDRFAELFVNEHFADAGPETVAAERVRERQEAKRADEFKNCVSEVQANEHDCAMKAQSSDALIKCLE